jgi:hypothetical protein
MFGCGAGYHHLFVDAVGNVCPCDLTPMAFGNVLEEGLGAIWERMGEHFGRPRCGCFMKEICQEVAERAAGGELPLALAQSEEICRGHKYEGGLPRVYENLFQGPKMRRSRREPAVMRKTWA